jgi:hypothetical protein
MNAAPLRGRFSPLVPKLTPEENIALPLLLGGAE